MSAARYDPKTNKKSKEKRKEKQLIGKKGKERTVLVDIQNRNE